MKQTFSILFLAERFYVFENFYFWTSSKIYGNKFYIFNLD